MYKYKKASKGTIKNLFTIIGIIILTGIISISLYKIYEGIEIDTYMVQAYEAEKTAVTIEEKKKKGKEVADIVEKVSSCVVGISKIKNAGNTVFLENSATSLGLGTGIIISENGYILSNEHVTGNKYANCYITLENSRTYNASVVWADEILDLSISKINAKNLTYATLGDSDNIRVGEEVYAIGNPIGFEFQRTVTSGIISAINRTVRIDENDVSIYMEDLIQTDTTINPGNSGGPLINLDGNVIGLTSVKITSADGIGFAIPINIVKPIIEAFTKEGKFEEAYLGIFAYDKEIIPYLEEKVDNIKGIYVGQVSLDSPAYKAGIKIGDKLIKIDNLELNKMSDLRCYIYSKKPGDEVKFKLVREGREQIVNVVLGSQ